VSDGEGVSWARRPVCDWERPYYPNYHEDMDMSDDTVFDITEQYRNLKGEYLAKCRETKDLRTILGEVRSMLEEGDDPTGIIGYIDESLTRIRR